MNARLTPTQHGQLNDFIDALNSASGRGVVETRGDSPFAGYVVADPDLMNFMADTLRTALTADAKPNDAERAATAIGRHALQDFLDQIHQPGISSGVVMYASKKTGGQAICTTTATALQNLLDDANLSPTEHTTLDVPAAVSFDGQIPGRNYREFAAWWNASTASGQCALWTRLDRLMREDTASSKPETKPTIDTGVTLNPIGLNNFLDEAAVLGHRDITLLASGTPTRPSISAYVTIQTLRSALNVEPEPEPETKPTDTDLPAGLGTDPDPYGIDLRGPHATIRSADRATLGGLADLDPRDRALYRALLHTALDNLDRTEPTQTVIRAGNR